MAVTATITKDRRGKFRWHVRPATGGDVTHASSQGYVHKYGPGSCVSNLQKSFPDARIVDETLVKHPLRRIPKPRMHR